MLQRPIDPEEMLSLVEGEQCGVTIPVVKRREIEAIPENRALYAELSASVRALRAMPLQDAPTSVWTALDAAYDETFGAARERTAASQPSPTKVRRLTEARTAGTDTERRDPLGQDRVRIRRRWATAVAAACLIAAGITIWSIARTGGDPSIAPNGLRFVETSVARIVDDLAPRGGERMDRGRVVYSFLTRTQTLYQGVGEVAFNGATINGTVLSGVAPSAGN